ncbi:MAG: flagellar brake protein [Catonella sp.]
MTTYSISIGDKVDIIRQAYVRKDTGEVDTLSSKIIDIIDEITFKLTMPMNKTITIPLEIGEESYMYFYTAYGILAARTVVSERFFEGSLAVMVVKLITELEKSQRRQYYRLQCSIEAKTHILTEEEKKGLRDFIGDSRLVLENKSRYIDMVAENTSDWEDCIVIDLSGGGVKYLSDKELPKHELVILAIKLKTGEHTKEYFLLMNIISAFRKSVESAKFEIRTKFIGLREASRDAIVRFVFEEERRNRKKETL